MGARTCHHLYQGTRAHEREKRNWRKDTTECHAVRAAVRYNLTPAAGPAVELLHITAKGAIWLERAEGPGLDGHGRQLRSSTYEA